MIEIYYTYQPVDSESFTRFILARYYNIPNAQICKSIHGKPYIKGDKVFFNATHSKGLLALAVGKKEVGLDIESLSGKPRPDYGALTHLRFPYPATAPFPNSCNLYPNI